MTKEEYYEWLDQTKKSKSYFSDFSAPFSDYLEDPEGKFVIALTKSQYIFYAGIGGDHAFMAVDIIKAIRPDLDIDEWGNSFNKEEDFRSHNILIFGYSHYSLISLPDREKLSLEQYKELEQIILYIKEYNEKNPRNKWELFVDAPEKINIKSGNYETKIDELLMLLENYITEDYKVPEEIIIGKPISKKEDVQNNKNSI